MEYLHVKRQAETFYGSLTIMARRRAKLQVFGSWWVLVSYLYRYNMNRHKRPFISLAIKFQLLMCIYPMVHVFFSPHICITTALPYKIPVRMRKHLRFTLFCSFNKQKSKIQGQGGMALSVSCCVALIECFLSSWSLNECGAEKAEGLCHGMTGGCVWRIITVSTQYGSISDLLGWHLQSIAVRH